MTAIVVVDDFYNDPDQVRSQALLMSFDYKGRYPGRRTPPFQSESLQQKIQDHLIPRIAPEPDGNFRFQFQIATAAETSWVHTDQNSTYAGVLYLTPNAPPDSGTSFYRHRATGFYRFDEAQQPMLDREGGDDSKWEETDRIANKYNRLVLYDSKLFHRSTRYFGDDLQTGRLFQVFFFNMA